MTSTKCTLTRAPYYIVGAYVLYPSEKDVVFIKGPDDVPSVGAFPLRPDESYEDEKSYVILFFRGVAGKDGSCKMRMKKSYVIL